MLAQFKECAQQRAQYREQHDALLRVVRLLSSLHANAPQRKEASRLLAELVAEAERITNNLASAVAKLQKKGTNGDGGDGDEEKKKLKKLEQVHAKWSALRKLTKQKAKEQAVGGSPSPMLATTAS